MIEQALQCLDESDTFSAVEFLNQQHHPLRVAEAYNELVKTLYWQRKDIARVVALSRAGIQYCSDQATLAAPEDMSQAFALRGAAKQLAYNLASFTWPGWNESGIDLSPDQVASGLDAARLNLRLALELDKGDLALSRAWWMLGAQLLAAHALAGSAVSFRRAVLYADRAGADVDMALSACFAALADLLALPCKTTQESFAVARMRLLALDGGTALIDQVDNTLAVFSAVSVDK